jgi:hypothetical protein
VNDSASTAATGAADAAEGPVTEPEKAESSAESRAGSSAHGGPENRPDSGPDNRAGSSAVFRERLYLTWWHWLLPLLAAGLLAAEVNMGYPGIRAWLPYVVCFALCLVLLWRFSAAKVEVHDGELWVGDAHLPLEFVGEVQIVPPAAKRKVLGPAFDPAAFALTRSWIGPMVWVEVKDENDPTPYWLISSRKPEKLVTALIEGR